MSLALKLNTLIHFNKKKHTLSMLKFNKHVSAHACFFHLKVKLNIVFGRIQIVEKDNYMQ